MDFHCEAGKQSTATPAWERRCQTYPRISDAVELYAAAVSGGGYATFTHALLTATTTDYGVPVLQLASWMREEAEARVRRAVRRAARLLDALLLTLGQRGGVSLSLAREGYAFALGVPVAELPVAREFERRALGLTLPEEEAGLRQAIHAVEADFFGVTVPLSQSLTVMTHLTFLGSTLDLWSLACGALPVGYILGRRRRGANGAGHAWLCEEFATPGVSPAVFMLHARTGVTVIRTDALKWGWEYVWRPALADEEAGGPVTGWRQEVRRHVCRLGRQIAERTGRSLETFFTNSLTELGLAKTLAPDEVLAVPGEERLTLVRSTARALAGRHPTACAYLLELCALQRELAAVLRLNDQPDALVRRFLLLLDFCCRWSEDGPDDLSFLPLAYSLGNDGTLERTQVFKACCLLASAAAAEVKAVATLLSGEKTTGLETRLAVWADGLPARLLRVLGVRSQQTPRDCRTFLCERLGGIGWPRVKISGSLNETRTPQTFEVGIIEGTKESVGQGPHNI